MINYVSSKYDKLVSLVRGRRANNFALAGVGLG